MRASARTNTKLWSAAVLLSGAILLSTLTVPVQAAPGEAATIKIRDASGGLGNEVTDFTLAAGATKVLCAAAYDDQGAYVGDVPAVWAVAGKSVEGGAVNDVAAFVDPDVLCPVLVADRVGTATIAAQDAEAHTDTTGPLTVIAGAVTSITIRDLPAGKGNPVGAFTLTADETKTLHAAGYDARGNFAGDQAATWSALGACGTATVGPAASTTFTATTTSVAADNCRARALFGGSPDDTGAITVTPGRLSTLRIRTAVNNGGAEVSAQSFNTDQTLALFAAGYDADNNYRGDENVAWAVVTDGALCGRVVPPTGSTTVFDATTLSAAADNCRVRATLGASTRDTGAFTVTPGLTLASLRVRDAAGLEAFAPVAADSTLTLFAAGFDSDANFMGNQEGTQWSLSDNTAGTLTPQANGASVLFNPRKPGTVQITATKNGVTKTSAPIAIAVGAVAAIKIRDGPGGTGAEVNSFTLTADQQKILWAAGYDADDNFVGDQPATWQTVNFACGTFIPQVATPGVVFDATKKTTLTNDCRVQATAAAHTDLTGAVIINPGARIAIGIHDAPGGAGQTVPAFGIATDGTKDLYAVGTDADGNFVDNIGAATWTILEPCGDLSAAVGSGITFDPTLVTLPGQKCRIRAEATGSPIPVPQSAETGTITVTAASTPALLKIRTQPGGGGIELGVKDITTDQSQTLYAAAYDQDRNFIQDWGTAVWTLEPAGTDRATVTSPGQSTMLDPKKPGPVTVHASITVNGKTIDDATGTITISVGALDRLRIRDAANGLGLEVGAFTINSGVTKVLHAGGYDADGNYIGDRSVAWSVVNNCGTVGPANGPTTTFTAGFADVAGCVVRAQSAAIVDDTGAVTVVTPGVSVIKIRDQANNQGAEVGPLTLNADQSLLVWAAGYDNANNYLGDQDVVWSVTGGIGALSTTGPSRSVTFNANVVGTGSIVGTLGSVVGPSGPVTVTPGAFNQLAIAGAPSPATAGTSFTLTVSARDADNNVKTTFAGQVTFSSSDPDAELPNMYTFVAGDAGTKQFQNVEYRTSGTHTITVQSGAVSRATSPITITHSTPAKFAVQCSAGACNAQAGASFGLTITAKDAFNNPVTSYTGSHNLVLSGAGNAPKGTVPQCGGADFGTATALTFTAGVATTSCTLYKAETANLVASEGAITTTTPLSVPVAAAAPVKLTALFPGQVYDPVTDKTSGAVGPLFAGTPQALTIRVLDLYRNVATSYTGDHTLHFDGALAAPTGTAPTASDKNNADRAFGTPTTLTFANGVVTTNVKLFRKAPNVLLNATEEAGLTNRTSAFAVTPGAATFLGILSCSPTADNRACILRSRTVQAAFHTPIGSTVTYFAGLFDDWDNVITVGQNMQGASEGTTRDSPCTTPAGSLGTLTLTCTYGRAGTDLVTITTLPTLPVLSPVVVLEVLVP